jgi:hypothetical protein
MPLHPIVPTRRKEPFDDDSWAFEVKWDGFRGLADTVNGRMLSKNGNPLSQFNSFLDTLPPGYIFDGGICALDGRLRSTRMKIAVLCYKDVSSWYAATLMERGHEVTMHVGGAIHATGLKPYLDCDGCLLLGDEPDLLEIADYMAASGEKVWRELADIPAAKE